MRLAAPRRSLPNLRASKPRVEPDWCLARRCGARVVFRPGWLAYVGTPFSKGQCNGQEQARFPLTSALPGSTPYGGTRVSIWGNYGAGPRLIVQLSVGCSSCVANLVFDDLTFTFACAQSFSTYPTPAQPTLERGIKTSSRGRAQRAAAALVPGFRRSFHICHYAISPLR